MGKYNAAALARRGGARIDERAYRVASSFDEPSAGVWHPVATARAAAEGEFDVRFVRETSQGRDASERIRVRLALSMNPGGSGARALDSPELPLSSGPSEQGGLPRTLGLARCTALAGGAMLWPYRRFVLQGSCSVLRRTMPPLSMYGILEAASVNMLDWLSGSVAEIVRFCRNSGVAERSRESTAGQKASE